MYDIFSIKHWVVGRVVDGMTYSGGVCVRFSTGSFTSRPERDVRIQSAETA
jgi:hypothetical protein